MREKKRIMFLVICIMTVIMMNGCKTSGNLVDESTQKVVTEVKESEVVETEKEDKYNLQDIVVGQTSRNAREFLLDVSSYDAERGYYIIFRWVNFLVGPTEICVLNYSSDKKYEPNWEMSENGKIVFEIPENAGAHRLYLDSDLPIYVDNIEIISKDKYSEEDANIENDTTLQYIEFTALEAEDEVVYNDGGITVYAKEYKFSINEDYPEKFYVIFNWINSFVQPVEMYIISPSGKEYERDVVLSEDGQWVFIVPYAEEGVYTIFGETTSTIEVRYYEALGKKDYFAIYKNLNIETGEPMR